MEHAATSTHGRCVSEICRRLTKNQTCMTTSEVPIASDTDHVRLREFLLDLGQLRHLEDAKEDATHAERGGQKVEQSHRSNSGLDGFFREVIGRPNVAITRFNPVG